MIPKISPIEIREEEELMIVNDDEKKDKHTRKDSCSQHHRLLNMLSSKGIIIPQRVIAIRKGEKDIQRDKKIDQSATTLRREHAQERETEGCDDHPENLQTRSLDMISP